MSYGLLNLGTQALTSNRTALTVVGQNISNVNTDGYSRQRAEFASRENIGGVEVYDISRIADEFLNRQIRTDTSSYSSADIFQTFANELDNLLASEATSISSAMDDYFSALQASVDDPTSLPNRELFLAEAEALTLRFNDLDANLERQGESINGRLDSAVAQINAIARNIAELNDKLRIASAAGSEVNELLDKRDAQLDALAEYVNFTTVETGNTGEVDVFIGKGEPLVVGRDSNELVTTLDPVDSSKLNVSLRVGNNLSEISGEISGGEIGGLLDYRNTILDTARDQLGVIALAFADTMNQQHMKGMDLDDELGGLLFTDINSATAVSNRVLSDSNNLVDVNARMVIEDTSALKASEYKLVFNSSNSFTLVRESDGTRWDSASLVASGAASFGTDGNLTLSVDGFRLTMDPATLSFGAGDQFILRPARTAAADIAVVLSEPRDLALAAPVVIEADSDNQGSGKASVSVTSRALLDAAVDQQALVPPLSIEFSENSAGELVYRVYDVTDPQNPVEIDNDGDAATPIPAYLFVAGEALELPQDYGYEIVIRNTPVAGDRFTVDYNVGGVSDNRNALAMSDLQFDRTTVDNASYQDRYGQMIEKVGTQTAVAQINAQASKSVLDANLQARSSLSGVNLDEEAAKLIQFQQAYTASAQLIKASQTIFDALIAAV